MKYVVVAIFDKKSAAFSRPAAVGSVGLAVRSFTDEVNRSAPDNDLWKHPEDFDVYHIGDYDDEKGLLTPLIPPAHLAHGSTVKA